ncbi:MAG: hypothetical protein HN348_28720, partial [Proteobacteria bacterium]|nr:hypothetical protein [Pseudomonadota bacterium]
MYERNNGPSTCYLGRVILILFINLAFASDHWGELRQRTVRAMQLDQIQGAPRTARDDTMRWRSFAPPAAPHLAANWAAINSRLQPNEWQRSPLLIIEPAMSASYGNLTPVNLDGEAEPGQLHLVQSTRCTFYWRAFEAHLSPTFALDSGGMPTESRAFVRTWQLGLRTPGFHLGFGQKSRWYGPG